MKKNYKKREIDAETKRHDAILRIILNEKIREQKTLATLLGKEDISASQSTISRDLAKLEVSLLDGYYQTKAARQLSSVQQCLKDLMYERVIFASDDVKLTGIQVDYGFSEPIARLIDTAYDDQIIGTLTGPQSVIVVAPNTTKGIRALKMIYEMVPSEKKKMPNF